MVKKSKYNSDFDDDFDFDDDYDYDYDIEEEFDDEPKKKKTKNKNKNKTSKNFANKTSKKKIPTNSYDEEEDDEESDEGYDKSTKIKSVLKIGSMIVVPIVTLVGGVIIGTSIGSTETPTTKTEVKEVVKQDSLSESVSGIKDSQLNLLKQQLANLKNERLDLIQSKTGTTDVSKFIDQKLLSVAKLSDKTSDKLDKFFTKVLAVKRFVKDDELETIKKGMEEDVEDPTNTLLYKLLGDRSPSKELEKDGIKAGTVFGYMIGYSPSSKDDTISTTTYAVEVPFVTISDNDNKNYIAKYIVTLDDSNDKIVGIKYQGYIKVGDVDVYMNNITNQLKIAENFKKETEKKSSDSDSEKSSDDKANKSSNEDSKKESDNKSNSNKVKDDKSKKSSDSDDKSSKSESSRKV